MLNFKLDDILEPLPERIVLLDRRQDETLALSRSIAMMRRARSDTLNIGSGFTLFPQTDRFTLVGLADDGRQAASLLTGGLALSGSDLRVKVYFVFTDIRFRRQGHAARLGDALCAIALRALLEIEKEDPRFGLHGHHVHFHAVTLGGEAVCRRIEERMSDMVVEIRNTGRMDSRPGSIDQLSI